jgi:hypothetical protein
MNASHLDHAKMNLKEKNTPLNTIFIRNRPLHGQQPTKNSPTLRKNRIASGGPLPFCQRNTRTTGGDFQTTIIV